MDNLIIITGSKFTDTLREYLEFKKYFFNLPDSNIITVEEIENSKYYKEIDDDGLLEPIIDEYKKVIDDIGLNPIQVEGKARFLYKMTRAIHAKIRDLHDNNQIDWLLFIGSSGIIPPYCYYYKGLDSVGNEIKEIYFSDMHYGNVSNDDLIDIPVARISVISNYRLRKILRKILHFEKKIHEYIKDEDKEKEDYDWIDKSIMISDPVLDSAGNPIYNTILNKVKNYIDDKISDIKVFEGIESESDFLESFNGGAIFCQYFGQGERIGWKVDNGLNINNIKDLKNAYKTPIVISNCSASGALQYERERVFIQELLNWENGGSIFSIGWSGLLGNEIYETFNSTFLKAIFEGKINRVGKIIQHSLNIILKSLSVSEGPLDGNLHYETIKKYIYTQTSVGDPTLRLPFNLPDSEDDDPYEIEIPEPEEPEEKPVEKLFEEWKQKISDSILKKIYLPLDFLRNIKLDSHEKGDFVKVTVRNLYEGKKIVEAEIPEIKNAEINYYTEEEIESSHREAPVAYEEKSYSYPIEGTDEVSDCPDCEGSGRIDCEYCDGGTTPSGSACSVCEGVGSIECERCEGYGEVVTLDIRIWKWQPVFDNDYCNSFEVDLKNKMHAISPEGTNFILKVENATLDDFNGNEELLKDVIAKYEALKENADSRTTYKDLEIIDTELQRSEADHAPVIKLCCKYKEKDFDVYIMGELDRRYVFKSPNIPKNFTLIIILIAIIVSVIVTLTILYILYP
ncbi:MAG: hypothetical protein GF329_17730 [Candidatus Lokiarchaeota archaeon]|nr:hypothetical protein [Candidatus Lokiarchaeota archaeon]